MVFPSLFFPFCISEEVQLMRPHSVCPTHSPSRLPVLLPFLLLLASMDKQFWQAESCRANFIRTVMFLCSDNKWTRGTKPLSLKLFSTSKAFKPLLFMPFPTKSKECNFVSYLSTVDTFALQLFPEDSSSHLVECLIRHFINENKLKMDLKVGLWQNNYLYFLLGPLSWALHEQLCQSCLQTVPM